jgi:hypothetical protein
MHLLQGVHEHLSVNFTPGDGDRWMASKSVAAGLCSEDGDRSESLIEKSRERGCTFARLCRIPREAPRGYGRTFVRPLGSDRCAESSAAARERVNIGQPNAYVPGGHRDREVLAPGLTSN